MGKPLIVHVMGEQRAEVEKKLEGPAGHKLGLQGCGLCVEGRQGWM